MRPHGYILHQRGAVAIGEGGKPAGGEGKDSGVHVMDNMVVFELQRRAAELE